MKFQGKIDEQGLLRIINRKGFDEFILQWAGKDVEIEVSKKKSRRSLPQNSYYWSAVIPIIRQAFRELGHQLDNEETHEFLKHQFLKESIITEDGEYLGERIKSSTELTKSEFMDYIAEIQQFAAEKLSVYIPDPNEQTNLNFNN